MAVLIGLIVVATIIIYVVIRQRGKGGRYK